MTSAPSPAKKRCMPRVDMEIPAAITDAGGKKHEVAIGNLGPEGAYIKTTKKFDSGAKVSIGFRITSHPLPFDVPSEVRWHRDGPDGGIGIHFIDFPPYDRAAVDDFCQHRIEESRGAAITPGG